MSPADRAKYHRFIEGWAKQHNGNVLQTCEKATERMVEAFPELKRVRGTVVMRAAPDGDTRPWPHWWCIDGDGTIVDPTASQFPSELDYTEADESTGGPTGKCTNCGGLCYEHRTPCCSDKCERDYAAYINGW